MSPEAISKRLAIVDELNQFTKWLSTARIVDRVEAPETSEAKCSEAEKPAPNHAVHPRWPE